MRIREATGEDHARIAEITLAAYRAVPGGRVSSEYEAHLADVAGRVEDGGVVLVAEDDAGTVVGTVTLVLEPSELFEHRWEIDGDCGFRMLAVDPHRTGEGIGRALVRTCVDRALAAGRQRMVITTMPWMRAAHRMYERFGFVRQPEIDQHYSVGTGLALSLDLTGLSQEEAV